VVAVIMFPTMVTGGMDQKKGLDNQAVMEALEQSSTADEEATEASEPSAESSDAPVEKSDEDALKELMAPAKK
jgi:hypothetical protein